MLSNIRVLLRGQSTFAPVNCLCADPLFLCIIPLHLACSDLPFLVACVWCIPTHSLLFSPLVFPQDLFSKRSFMCWRSRGRNGEHAQAAVVNAGETKTTPSRGALLAPRAYTTVFFFRHTVCTSLSYSHWSVTSDETWHVQWPGWA